jgi:hypothetical protein
VSLILILNSQFWFGNHVSFALLSETSSHKYRKERK